jgi:hypothetical protein
MKKLFPALLLLLGLVNLFTGCAYTAHVRGVAGEDTTGEIPQEALICVAVDPEAPEVEHSKEITRKLEKLLSRQGYRPSTSSDAEYFLFFDLESKPLITRAGLEPLGGIRSGIKTYEKEGPYDLTLSLRLVESSSYHERGTEQFVWVGGAILSSAPTESCMFIDLILVAAMKYFPEDTGEVRKTKIGLYDFRARRLRK